MSPSCYLLRYVTMKVDSHVRRTTSANDDENADEPKVTKVYVICMQGHLTSGELVCLSQSEV